MKILSFRFKLSYRKVFFWCSVFISYQSSVLALFVGEITKFYRFKVRVTLLWCFWLWCFKNLLIESVKAIATVTMGMKASEACFFFFFFFFFFFNGTVLSLSVVYYWSDFPGGPKMQSWKSVCFLWTLHQYWLSNSEYLSFDCYSLFVS